MIEVKDLCKNYGSRSVLKSLSFTLPPKQIVGFLGINGAGKSTTMNLLTGYLAPTSGTIRIGGADLNAEPAKAKQRSGYLPEIPPVYPGMTVAEQLQFAYELKSVHPRAAETRQQIDRVCSQTQLTDVRNRLIRNLSKGYRQRVGIAQALLGQPEVLILDEPTAGLDPKQMLEIRTLIRELGKTHTILFSSHILSEVSALCDRILVLSQGRILADGTPAELTQLTCGSNLLSLSVGNPSQALRRTLAAIPGVLSCTETEPGEYRIHYTDADVRSAVSAAVVTGGGALLGLCPVLSTLEDLFLKLEAQHAGDI